MATAPIPSATVVLLRGGDAALETLLLQRAPRGDQAGAWVFPGGRVEPEDVVAGAPGSVASARRAAVRETTEEAALELSGAKLLPLSRWITPEIMPKRFDTWFFLGDHDPEQEVRPDGRELVAHRWVSPGKALQANAARELELAPPQFVTLNWLAEFDSASSALQTLPQRAFITFRPKVFRTKEGAVMLYSGDAGYERGDPKARGARHRALRGPHGAYCYQRSD